MAKAAGEKQQLRSTRFQASARQALFTFFSHLPTYFFVSCKNEDLEIDLTKATENKKSNENVCSSANFDTRRVSDAAHWIILPLTLLALLASDLKSFQVPFFNPNIVSSLVSRGASFQSKAEFHVGWIAQEFIAHFQGLLNLI